MNILFIDNIDCKFTIFFEDDSFFHTVYFDENSGNLRFSQKQTLKTRSAHSVRQHALHALHTLKTGSENRLSENEKISSEKRIFKAVSKKLKQS
jgi:hypothetical protein